MRRYWIEKNHILQDHVQFEGEVFHHIFDVCRQHSGSRFEVLVDDSTAYLVEISEVGKKSARGKIIESRKIAPLPLPHIHLALSVPRFPVLESVIEKSVELGVHSIHLFFSDYSFVRGNEKISTNKLERWNKIIVGATQQSGRGELMKLMTPVPIDSLLQDWQKQNKDEFNINQNEGRWGLFAYEGPAVMGVKEFLTQRRQVEHSTESQQTWIFVGSEGGFSHREVDNFTAAGLKPITLGQQILRVETACVTLVSVLKYELDLM